MNDMTDSDYDFIKSVAYEEASMFLTDAESANADDADNEIHPGLFSEMLERFPQYEAEDISQVIHWGINDAWYDVIRGEYGAKYFD